MINGCGNIANHSRPTWLLLTILVIATYFPLIAFAQVDTDVDGITNDLDFDDDNDGLSDRFEVLVDLDPLDPTDAQEDADGDGVSNLLESIAGTDPTDSASVGPGPVGCDTTVDIGPLTVLGQTLAFGDCTFGQLIGGNDPSPADVIPNVPACTGPDRSISPTTTGAMSSSHSTCTVNFMRPPKSTMVPLLALCNQSVIP